MENLGELGIERVGGEQTLGLLVRGSKTDLGVDVEGALSTAWGPDCASLINLVGLEVIAVKGTSESGSVGSLLKRINVS